MILSKETTKKIDEFVRGITGAFIDMAKSETGIHDESLHAYAKLIEAVGSFSSDAGTDISVVGFTAQKQGEDNEDE